MADTNDRKFQGESGREDVSSERPRQENETSSDSESSEKETGSTENEENGGETQ